MKTVMAPAPMPTCYIVEMFMDRVAACKVYHGAKYKDQDPLAYYESSKTPPPLHKKTKRMLEFLLHMLAEQGEERTFLYIRKKILNK